MNKLYATLNLFFCKIIFWHFIKNLTLFFIISFRKFLILLFIFLMIIILPLVYLIFRNCPFFVWIALNTFVIVAFLFVYNFKVKKLKGVWYTIFTIGAIVGSALVIWKW